MEEKLYFSINENIGLSFQTSIQYVFSLSHNLIVSLYIGSFNFLF